MVFLVDTPRRNEETPARNLFELTQIGLASEPTTKQLKNDIKKIIKKPKTLRLQNPNLTTGRFKKVQFNTLPEFSTQKNRKGVLFLAEFNKEPSLNADLVQVRRKNIEEERLLPFESDGEMYLEKSKFFFFKFRYLVPFNCPFEYNQIS